MVPLQPLLSTFIALIIMGQNRVWGQEIIPNLKEQVIPAGTDLKLTCRLYPNATGDGKTFFLLPDSITQFPELRDVNNRLNLTIGPDLRSSTMILSKTRPEETGIYGCTTDFFSRTHFSKQYVYVTRNKTLIFIDLPITTNSKLTVLAVRKGQDLLIPCKPTHPNVSVSLTPRKSIFSQFTPNELKEFWLTDKRFTLKPTKIPLNRTNSRWTFDPTEGIKLKDAKISDSGEFICQGQMDNVTQNETIFIKFKGVEVERIGDPSDPTEGSNISLICRNFGSRNSTLKWFYKINTRIANTKEMQIDLANHPTGINVVTNREKYNYVEVRSHQKDNFKTIRLDLFGISRRDTPTTFRCESYEDGETFSESISFQIRAGSPILNIVAVISLFLLVVAIGNGIQVYRNQQRKIQLLKGDSNKIRGDVPMAGQIECLPYDKRWEFPTHRLKLGAQLWEGHFGRVLHAEAVGSTEEIVGTVAVKTTVTNTNDAALEALVSELKILIYLGSHLNVVNLLGACTKEIHKGKLLLIVEYCRFGDLRSFLVSIRNNFVNQVDEFGQLKVGNFKEETDPRMKRRSLLKHSSFLREKPGNQTRSLSYTNEAFEMNEIAGPSTILDASEEDDPLNQLITTPDLISCAFQIARGMDYLATKKIIHGNLTARNVLLADDGVAKVADFGMAKKMYDEEIYEKTGQGAMPIQWMAIESLKDRIFSTKSDVWSYGVVLWELFTLGQTPYPGMDGHEMVREIQKGFRMEKPELAPDLFGEMMADCWKTDPNERPTFLQMEEAIVGQLESSVISNYLKMNEHYTRLNIEREIATARESFGLSKLLKS